MVCNAGLALCTVCGGAEASLPSECPGRMLNEFELWDIQRGAVDYKHGGFFKVAHNDLTEKQK